MHKLEQGWCLDPSRKIIYKKSTPLVSWLLTSLGLSKTSMRDLWSMTIRGFSSSSELTKYIFPLDHDNFLKPPSYPFYFRLNGGWKIDRNSIKFLKNGPLFSEDGINNIVPAKIFIKALVGWVGKFIVAISTIFSLLGISLLSLYYKFFA